MGIGILSWVAFSVWALSEIYINIRTKLLRQHISTTKVDKGSNWFIGIGIYLGAVIAFIFHYQNWGWVSQPVAIIGAVLMLAGVALRLWSIHVLGRYFTPVVSIDSDQKLIKDGPYKHIRHPAYTGMLITLTFLGLAFNSWIASCIILFMLSPCLIYRIHIEEKALISHFRSAYEEYCRSTWRLIPFLW